MSNYKVTKESFLKDVAKHRITILKDDGVYRHIRLSEPGTNCQSFNIVTWPGYLSYSGDMGCFVFSRVEDMFRFFRDDSQDWSINTGYWGEKLQAVDRYDGASQWSQSSFEDAVKDTLNDWLEMANEEEYESNFIDEQTQKVEGLINESREHESHAVAAINNWWADDRGVDFQDFWEHGLTESTTRYLWCCHALVWAIRQYDSVKNSEKVAA